MKKLLELVGKMTGGSSLLKLRKLVEDGSYSEALELVKRIPQTTGSSNQAKLDFISMLKKDVTLEDAKEEVKTETRVENIIEPSVTSNSEEIVESDESDETDETDELDENDEFVDIDELGEKEETIDDELDLQDKQE